MQPDHGSMWRYRWKGRIAYSMLCKSKRVGLVSVLPRRQPLPLKDYDPLNLTRECASHILDLLRFGVQSVAPPRQPAVANV